VRKSLVFLAALLPILACAATTTVTGAVTFDYDLSPFSIYKPDSLPNFTAINTREPPFCGLRCLAEQLFPIHISG
jgi:hypothetical protein